ncbi:MAG: RHS repeat-associated core domain-containing protein [Lentisphaerae bacterium]|nr:RHS repeat-associated core domain-containing protein [Lentisphaerota bacterium]
MTQIENSLGTNIISSYTYANDALGRRTSAGWQGTAFDELGPTVMKYAYNTRSEVIGAERFFGDNPATATEPVSGQNWGYAFDPIGNRLTAARDSDTEIYTANNLNQYTQRTIPGAAHVAGTADENATVTINRPSISGTTVEPVTHHGAYFHKKLALDNSAHADAEEIEVIGVKAGAGTGGVDIVSTYTGFVWAAKSPEQFTYDADGNILSDALRQYEWDAENRLIAVTVSNVVDGSLTRVEIAYDYMSRRVSKKVYSKSSSNFEFQISSISYFLYDGWNLIREITTATGLGSITDDYVWGLDLSGSLQGAGGIGGLLARYRTEHRYYDGQDMLIICHRPPGNPENKQTLRINESAWSAHQAHGDTLGACDGSSVSNSAFLYTYDGNGNVSELLQSTVNSPQSIVGHYEYSPFGETIAAIGPEAQDNPFHFSTKYTDEETGLVMYPKRPYSPGLGRWLSRDTIGTRGGKNLYGFVANSPIHRIDPLGLQIFPGPSPGGNEPPSSVSAYCCGTPVKVYDPETHCCCKKGAVVSSDLSSECKLVDKKEISSGAVKHKANGIPIPDAPAQIHYWLSWSGYGSDGSADSNAPNNVGKVSSPAAYQIDDYPTEDVKLSPCEYDFTEFHKCLSDTAQAQDGQSGPQCYTFVSQLLRTCMDASKGCTAK